MQEIKNGRFKVLNPYSRKIYRVPATPDQVHSIVFWSKNFGPFLRHRYGEMLMEKGYHLFFNFTINSPHTLLEPGIPDLEDRLEQLALLAANFGRQCIQWRFDPICLYTDAAGREKDNLGDFDVIARRVADLGIEICITSFADLYRKVLRRMRVHSNLKLIDPPVQRKAEIIRTLSRKLTAMGVELTLCCEREVLTRLPEDVSAGAAACIPNNRLMRLYGPGISLAKDRGQRRDAGCNCSVSKDIGSYTLHPCDHNCLFCYANPSMDSRMDG